MFSTLDELDASLLAAAGADHLAEADAVKLDQGQAKLFSIASIMGSLMPQEARLLWACHPRVASRSLAVAGWARDCR